MLHALRNASPKAREARDAGFTLIEILVAMVLMTIVMSSLAVFFIGAQKSGAALRVRQNATIVADKAMDTVHGFQVSKLLSGRDKSSSDAQWAAPVTGVDVSQMNEQYDGSAATGNGSNPATCTTLPTGVQTACLPTVPVAGSNELVNKTQYRVSYYIGSCWVPMGGGDCVPVKPVTPSPVLMDRAVVAVNWTDKGNGCPNHTCAYVIASLISVTGDPTFNVNQVLIDTTPPSTPTLTTCQSVSSPFKDVAIKLNSWSASTDASGVARYDIYRGTSNSFGTMAKIGTQTNTAAFTDYGLTPPLVPSQTYWYAVVALDTVGNQSAPQLAPPATSNPPIPPMITCSTDPDTFPPNAPTVAANGSTTTTASITWVPATPADEYQVAGYRIYRNGVQVGTTLASATSFTDSGLSPWVNYTYTVKAVDAYTNLSVASNSVIIQTKDTVAPSVPVVTLTGKPWPALEIDLDWPDSTDDVAVTGYTVWRATSSGGPWTQIGTTTTSTWPDTAGLVSNTKYYYYVTAHDAVPNTSGSSVVKNASTPDTIVPNAATALAAPTKAPTTLGITWTAATDNVGVVGYNIYRNGSSTPLNGSLLTTTSYTDTGLTQLTSYTYTVKAYDAAGNVSSPSTALVVSTTDGQAPTVPTVSSSATTLTSETLNWTTSTDNVGVSSYAIYRNGVFLANDPASPFTDSGLAPGTTYTYTVYAFDAAGNYSTPSNALPVTTLADTVAPSQVTNLKGTTGVPRATTVTWNASTDNVAVANYKVYSNGVLATTVASPATSLAISGLANSTTYVITVYAVDTSGNVAPVSANLSCVVNGLGTVTCT